MRLISLSANKPTFKTVEFNKTGASFILAKQDKPEQSDKSKTYNGVGKSLLVSLIDFCLGASTTNKITKSLQATLPDWHFILEIEINNQVYTIMRYTNTPKDIILDNEALSLGDFCSTLGKLCFEIPSEFQYLSFRSLLPFFIRPSKQSYINYDEPAKISFPYQTQLYNAFLLGLDIALSQKKMRLKKQIGETSKLHRNIQKDPILKQFFEGNRDPSLALADLNEKIGKLELDLKNFEVADDYYQIKQKADDIKINLDKTQNTIELRSINIENINQSLKISPDVNRNDIKSIYDESNLVFQSNVEKQLVELEKFYQDLTVNRTKRLQQQKNKILEELRNLEKYFLTLKKDLDNHMKFLNAHHALDVFVKINSRLADLRQNREKLLDYEKLQLDYEQKKTSLKKELLSQSEESVTYLEDVKDDINKIMEYFRMLVKRFYPKFSAGITVRNYDGENQIRYDIEAKIESDSSDGINSVKLFCYDLTLLTHGSNHSMDFIFHDSRLFSDIDEVHCDVLFEIVEDKFTDKQYIASINQNQLNGLSSDAQKFVKEHVIQELTDDSDSGKLLGITVELEYD